MKRKTLEEYIETIYVLEKDENIARTGAIAEVMKVKPPSVTEMLKKLEKDGYVEYKLFLGANLTKKGKKEGQVLMKRHQVIEDFLGLLGVSSKKAQEDACKLEHHISVETVDILKKFIKFIGPEGYEPLWLAHFKRYCKTGEVPDGSSRPPLVKEE